jgi:hypothetical protein
VNLIVTLSKQSFISHKVLSATKFYQPQSFISRKVFIRRKPKKVLRKEDVFLPEPSETDPSVPSPRVR